MKRCAIAVIAAAISLTSLIALAEPADGKAQGRELFAQAGAAFVAGDFTAAADLYERSHEAYPAPTALLWLARTLVKLGRLLEALDCYEQAATWKLGDASPPKFPAAVASAREERQDLQPTVPSVVITVEGASARVAVDGMTIDEGRLGEPILVDPGPHVVTVSAPGYAPVRRRLVAEVGRSIDVAVTLGPAQRLAPEPDASPQLIAGYAVGAVGVAAAVTWAVTGALYLGEAGVVDEHCDDMLPDGTVPCDEAGVDAASTGETLGVVNTVALFTGVAALATGLVLVLTADSGGDDTAVWRVVPSGAGAVLQASF